MTPYPHRRRRLVAAILAVLALTAAACSSDPVEPTADDDNNATDVDTTDSSEAGGSDTDSSEDGGSDTDSSEKGDSDDTTSTTKAPATTTSTAAPPLVDTVKWTTCGSLECATVEVPADYEDLSLGTIPIAINMLRAADTDRRIGVMMINPGGPGASGKGLTQAFTFGGFNSDLTDRFDIVGFDPRGVAESAPTFACGDSGEQLAVLTAVEDIYDTPEEIEVGEDAVELCVESMGPLAGRIHTDYVVRDMDEIRKAMGEEKITYLGYSYGSLIGVWYATLFPDSVRSMVIDGANNPLDEEDTFEERVASAREELQPIEDLLSDALNACDDSSCPIYNGGDPVGYYYETAAKFGLINEANANNEDAAFLALITPLYSQSSWPSLWEGLADLQERDDPDVFSNLLEFQLGDDPGAVNITAHINCLDSWALKPEKDRDARLAESAEFFAIEDELDAEFPLLAAIDSSSPGTCTFYDTIAPTPLAVPLDGGGVPILVVGNTSDPVTSFGESEELAEEILANGVLVKVDHPDHTVYPFNDCVNEIVDAVLLDVEYPGDTFECDRETQGTERLLDTTCQQLVPVVNDSLDGDTTDAVCERFATRAYAELGEETISLALIEDDVDASEQLFDILIEELLKEE